MIKKKTNDPSARPQTKCLKVLMDEGNNKDDDYAFGTTRRTSSFRPSAAVDSVRPIKKVRRSEES